jgi:hypothetical protein
MKLEKWEQFAAMGNMKDEISQGESLKTGLPVMIFAANSVGQAE